MHYSALLSAIFLVAVKADDFQLDRDDISTQCTSICRPILELSRTCDVDDDRVRDDLTEHRLRLQCICTNNSFDVQRFAGLCQSCMQQNPVRDGDDDDDDRGDRFDENNRDINQIVRSCGFSGATYSASDANAANGVVVSATRPDNANQLTTTIAGGAIAAPTGGSDASRPAGTNVPTGNNVPTGTRTVSTPSGTGAAATGTSAVVGGAPGLEPLSGGMKVLLTVVGAGVLGFWMH
ncbi:CAP22 [Diaporthe helianthi]|uniref:CAP22 n=1 Tax=Diaporthe helianthi TaxID=158607 RepID=A0A2P5HVR0_DIAHE|nr:CAP22 [Diaporthe helianthi]